MMKTVENSYKIDYYNRSFDKKKYMEEYER